MSKLTTEEKDFFIFTVNIVFNILNRAIKHKNVSLANSSLNAINKTINFLNEAEQEENKN